MIPCKFLKPIGGNYEIDFVLFPNSEALEI